MEWFGFFMLLGGERGVGECRLLSGLPSYSQTSGAGAHRAPVVDVPVIFQLKFRTWRCLRFRPRQSAPDSSCTTEARTCSANCAKAGDSTAQFLGRLFTRPLLCNDRCLGLDSAKKLWRFCSWMMRYLLGG